MSTVPLRITETLEVSGRGVVVVTNQRHHELNMALQVGQQVEFQTPEGRVLASTLRGLELFGSPFNPNKPFVFVVGSGIAKSDLPAGTLILFPREESGP